MRRRIGIYGGTFDPVHYGHLKVAEAVLSAFALDRIFFVPAFTPPHKRKRMISSPFHRMAMLALATADSPKMFVSTVELEAPSRPYTVETLGRLRTELQPARLFFMMGADSFIDVTSWREYEAILSEYDVIVATRPGYRGDDGRDGVRNSEETVGALAHQLGPRWSRLIVDLRGGACPMDLADLADTDLANEDMNSPRIYLTDYVSIDVSATGIREAVEQGRSIDDMVPPSVAAYIEKYRLYQKS
ncbi:MAG TPA: nicotinate-nucleotide adenylyltransferase [Blastocatellia bacterium]|nr:nicotinate-nucleotide adenylyltransferase [Blastocatellia bacterium]